MTALRSLEIAGLLLGKRMLVTGATGGVGRIAVQLGHASGALVTALVRDIAASAGWLRRLGAAAVTEQPAGDFDFILDAVGGTTFGLAIGHLAPRGVLVNIGTQDDEETVTFQARRFDRAFGARIYTLNLPSELASHDSAASDLARLCALAAAGRLDGQVEFEGSWRQPGPAIDSLLHRRIGGKAVLHVDLSAKLVGRYLGVVGEDDRAVGQVGAVDGLELTDGRGLAVSLVRGFVFEHEQMDEFRRVVRLLP
jgi:NADPH:quinone reductase-like Zn-dependent oxidoreductase